MIAIERSVAILLCAGLSRRFGADDKLMRDFEGRPLVQHAAATLAALPFKARVAVVPPIGLDLHRLLAAKAFGLVVNPDPAAGQQRSLAIGIGHAIESDPDAVFVCLGDMPRVTPTLLSALAEAANDDTAAASLGDGWRSPPCVFPRRILAALASGATRAPEVVAALPAHALVRVPPDWLIDVDTSADFERLAGPESGF